MENNKFLDKFESFIQQHKLIRKGDKVLVGFSGGADSTALALALWHLRSKLNFSLLAAHVNYQLRSEDSQQDEEFVKAFCFDRNISLVIKRCSIESDSNLEDTAREIRFTYFNQLLKSYKLNKMALGHNISDQAETIIFRLFRGSGYTGLKGITPSDGFLIHPLLGFSREEITDYLRAEGCSWREDKTNDEIKFNRNKIRHELLPWVSENLNANVVEKLYQTGEIFYQTDQILREQAQRRIRHARLRTSKEDFRFSLPILKKTMPVLRFYIYKELYSLLAGTEKDFYHSHFEEIEAILDADGSRKINLPRRVVVFKEYDELIFSSKIAKKKVDVNNTREITSLRTRVAFEDFRIIFAKMKKMPPKRYPFEDNFTTYLDLDKIKFPIIIRHRQPGDRFYPLGMENPKKLKDFFIDEKISKYERDKILLFSDSEKILWVAGYRVDNRVAISSKTNNILKVRLEKIAQKKARPAERLKKGSR